MWGGIWDGICPKCSAPNANGNAEWCTTCGATMIEGADGAAAQRGWVCTHCSYGNVASAVQCAKCGHDAPPDLGALGARMRTAIQESDGSRTAAEVQEEEETAFLEELCRREETALDNLRA